MSVCVIDIGRPDKNLGWAMRTSGRLEKGSDVNVCIKTLARALSAGPAALGFEAPMFVPMRSESSELTKARNGECAEGVNRPFSAGAGASVLVTGLVVVSYVLTQLRTMVPHGKVTFDWRSEPKGARSLLLFEAFVTGQKHANKELGHIHDALKAVEAFEQYVKDRSRFESALSEPNCLNLLGAISLRTGWTTDLAVLEAPCLVVKPN